MSHRLIFGHNHAAIIFIGHPSLSRVLVWFVVAAVDLSSDNDEHNETTFTSRVVLFVGGCREEDKALGDRSRSENENKKTNKNNITKRQSLQFAINFIVVSFRAITFNLSFI